MSLSYKECIRLNQRRIAQAENDRLNEMETHTAPLFWMVIAVSLFVICGVLINDYADDRSHDAAFAACLSGKYITADSATFKCVEVNHGKLVATK